MRKAIDCNGKIIKIGDYIKGAMSEVLIMGIEGKIEDIKFENVEAYGKLEGKEGYWHLLQFENV